MFLKNEVIRSSTGNTEPCSFAKELIIINPHLEVIEAASSPIWESSNVSKMKFCIQSLNTFNVAAALPLLQIGCALTPKGTQDPKQDLEEQLQYIGP